MGGTLYNFKKNNKVTVLFPTFVRILLFISAGRTNFSISPENIFKGDTVEMKCMLGSLSSNVTWYHRDRPISNSSKHSVITVITSGNTLSTLKITGIAQEDAGNSKQKDTEIIMIAI